MDMQTNQINNIIHGFASLSGPKREKPNEIPQPGRNPETTPTPEPEPGVWPVKEPEIKPGKEPLTTPPSAPPEVPEPPQG
jgi:hypothetical protein